LEAVWGHRFPVVPTMVRELESIVDRAYHLVDQVSGSSHVTLEWLVSRNEWTNAVKDLRRRHLAARGAWMQRTDKPRVDDPEGEARDAARDHFEPHLAEDQPAGNLDMIRGNPPHPAGIKPFVQRCLSEFGGGWEISESEWHATDRQWTWHLEAADGRKAVVCHLEADTRDHVFHAIQRNLARASVPPPGVAGTETPKVAPNWPESNMLEAAWGLIANCWRGDWDKASKDWRDAAKRWRDAYHGGPPGVARMPSLARKDEDWGNTKEVRLRRRLMVNSALKRFGLRKLMCRELPIWSYRARVWSAIVDVPWKRSRMVNWGDPDRSEEVRTAVYEVFRDLIQGETDGDSDEGREQGKEEARDDSAPEG